MIIVFNCNSNLSMCIKISVVSQFHEINLHFHSGRMLYNANVQIIIVVSCAAMCG